MTAGSKIKDDKQEYQYSIPFVTPSGHELTFYDTPDNQRLVIKHCSGSRIEFKADGSAFVKIMKDLHVHSSILSSQGGVDGASKPADASTIRYDTDLDIEIGGKLSIKAATIDIESQGYMRQYAATDFEIKGNNVIEKATESIALEGTKSIYVDTKEYTERSVSHVVEEGTKEDGGQGGISVLNVYGNCVIRNDDPEGGITLSSAGYLNLVCAKERVDVVGQDATKPSTMGLGTFTQQVFKPQGGAQNKSQLGDYVFKSDGGADYTYAQTTGSSTTKGGFGLSQTVTQGNMDQKVSAGNRTRSVAGNEEVTITGQQKITAAKIFLN